jgi:hypothetical protein
MPGDPTAQPAVVVTQPSVDLTSIAVPPGS